MFRNIKTETYTLNSKCTKSVSFSGIVRLLVIVSILKFIMGQQKLVTIHKVVSSTVIKGKRVVIYDFVSIIKGLHCKEFQQ